MSAGSPSHPAAFPPPVLEAIQDLLDRAGAGPRVLDPFAGTGGVHRLTGYRTIGVEIEPEWARLAVGTVVADATALPLPADCVDAVVTSPCYGNRMADHHEARDGSYRRTYRHCLGRPLHNRNAGALQWGTAYRDFHLRAWCEALRVLRPGGIFVLNVKDHRRAGRRIHVANWHHRVLRGLGLLPVTVVRVPSPGFRFGANLAARPLPERLLVLTLPHRNRT